MIDYYQGQFWLDGGWIGQEEARTIYKNFPNYQFTERAIRALMETF